MKHTMGSYFQRNRMLVLHISFWCVYISFLLYQMATYQRFRGHSLEIGLALTGVQLIFTIVITYLNYFAFLPRFLKHQNIVKYFLEFIVPFALFIIVRVHLQRWIIDGYTYREGYFYSSWHWIQISGVTLFIVIFVSMLRFAAEWFELEAKKREVENEKLTAELNFLKAQINPHFLFNTLNNLYYLAYSQSPNTTEVIAKLSQMMRYMITESNHTLVPLTKEIEYMQNYIALEKMRITKDLPIKFEINGKVENVWIAPLIFITFLENAFKHGVSNNSQGVWVNVSVDVQGNECIYNVSNGKLRNHKISSETKSGIGLHNVQRRLELSYPDKHQLTVENKEDMYSVQLKLQLT